MHTPVSTGRAAMNRRATRCAPSARGSARPAARMPTHRRPIVPSGCLTSQPAQRQREAGIRESDRSARGDSAAPGLSPALTAWEGEADRSPSRRSASHRQDATRNPRHPTEARSRHLRSANGRAKPQPSAREWPGGESHSSNSPLGMGTAFRECRRYLPVIAELHPKAGALPPLSEQPFSLRQRLHRQSDSRRTLRLPAGGSTARSPAANSLLPEHASKRIRDERT